jgi:hypothetical protein
MDFLPEAAGPHDPILTTVPRRPGSVRRTSNIDTARPDGMRADAVVDGRARDVRTNLDGGAEVVAEATLVATLSPSHLLLTLQTSPAYPVLDQLIGGSVGSGFRSRLNRLVATGDACEEGSLLFLLLDDLPGATLVSGYALHSSGALDPVPASASADPAPTAEPTPPAAVADPAPARPVLDFDSRGDLCAGWASDATMMVHIRRTGSIPVPMGPPAPVLERPDDPWSWHAMAPLAPHTVRRRRRLDLVPPEGPAPGHGIDLHFRDSHVDAGGNETIMHEYTVTGHLDVASGRIAEVAARAHVLPWLECPGAVASAQRIVGMELAALRPVVRKEFVGRSTCTHLNDSLRSLGDLAALRGELAADR